MNTKQLLLLSIAVLVARVAGAQGTAITYQGRLAQNGGSATGLYDMRFTLHDTLAGVAQIGGTLANPTVGVTNGLFTVTLDFGAGAFNGSPRWLQISVRTNGSAAAHTALSPRQSVTAAPYAILAGNVTGNISDSQLSANIARLNGSQTFTGTATFNPASGAPFGVGANANKVSNLNADLLDGLDSGAFWKLGGNAGSSPGANFLGATDGAQVRLHATGGFLVDNTTPSLSFGNQTRQMLNLWEQLYGIGVQSYTFYQRTDGNFAWYRRGTHAEGIGDPGAGGTKLMLLSDNGDLYLRQSIVVDDAALNDGGNRPALVFGPGSGEFIASVRGTNGANRYGMDFYTGFQKQMTILNGGNIGIGTATPQAKLDVAGSIRSAGLQLTAGAVSGAFLTSDATGNGSWNSSLRLDNVSTGTGLNVIYSQNFAIGGQNIFSNGIVGATISGGGNARIISSLNLPNAASGSYAAVGGGAGNLAGFYGTVPGGFANSAAGDYSFAAGRRAKANHAGVFVFADSQNADFASSWNNQFVIRALGGVGINTTTPNADLDVNGSTVVRGGLYVTGGGADIDTGAGSVQFRNESGLVPGINLAGGPIPGVLRLRNSLEVWPNDAGSQAGRIDVRNTSGSATITLDGGSGEVTVKVLNILGGADIAEPFQMSHAKEIPKGAVVVIDEENPGRLKMSDGAYDTRVAGIVSGANGINPGLALQQQGMIEGGQNVALTGRVYALADASSAPIKAGDLLTTSDTPGHVMKASDRGRGSGAILGKAMTSLKDGKGMVLVLVSLQ